MCNNKYLYNIQEEFEKTLTEEGIKKLSTRIMKAIDEGRFDQTPFGMVLYHLGYPKAVEGIKALIDAPLKGKQKRLRALLLALVDKPNVIAYLVLVSVIRSAHGVSNGLNSVNIISKNIVDWLLQLYLDQAIKTQEPKLYSYLGYEFRRASKARKRKIFAERTKDFREKNNPKVQGDIIQLGVMLLNAVVNSGANIFEIKTIVKHEYRSNAKKHKMITLTKDSIEIIQSIKLDKQANDLLADHPMVVPPRDWTAWDNGGYLTNISNLVIGEHLKHCKQ